MKPADRVLAELEPAVGPLRELGFALRRTGKVQFERREGRPSSPDFRTSWITIHRTARNGVVFWPGWSVHARLHPKRRPLSTILHAYSRQIPGWKAHRYGGDSVDSENYRLDHPDYVTVARPHLVENLVCGARLLIAAGSDLRLAADFAATQGNRPCWERTFELYIHLEDLASARAVLETARRAAANDPASLAIWERAAKLLDPTVVA